MTILKSQILKFVIYGLVLSVGGVAMVSRVSHGPPFVINQMMSGYSVIFVLTCLFSQSYCPTECVDQFQSEQYSLFRT